jgi:hypothetical protein
MSKSVSRPEIAKVIAYVWEGGTYREEDGLGIVTVDGKEILHQFVDPYAPKRGRVLIGRWAMSQLEQKSPDRSTWPAWLVALFAWFRGMFK